MSLHKLFNPSSVAVIGASTTPGSVGHIIIKNLLEEHFPGKVFPVNPKTDVLLGHPCYSTVTAIQEPIDLAIIVVPAKIVPAVLEEVGQKKIPSAIIISAGFKEAGVSGKVLEQQVKDISSHHRITLLGPNCLGFLHGSRSLNASFAKELGKSGPIAFFSQSGALCTTLLDETRDSLGYSHFVSVGNKALLKEKDFLQYFLEDEETKLIAFYTEDLENSTDIITLGRQALVQNPPKAIIALKSGTTEAGSSASSSHTGAVAGSDVAYNALLHQARITRAKSLAHLVELLCVYSQNSLPLGNKLAIITNAGGMGVLATDCATKSGLVMAPLSDATTQKLGLGLPAAAGIHNPIDVLGDAGADRYELALEAAVSDNAVDSLLVIVTPQAMTEGLKTAEIISQIAKKTSKPVVAVFTEGDTLKTGKELLIKNKVAVLGHAENAARALGNLATTALWQSLESATPKSTPTENTERKLLAHKILEEATLSNDGYLDQVSLKNLFDLYGFTFPRAVVVHGEQEAEKQGREFTGPVVLKILSPDILHKSDTGGVLLNVEPKNIAQGYRTIIETVQKNQPSAKIEGVLIAEMVTPVGPEILLGAKTEGALGKLVVAGLGGIYVEVFKDVAARFAPLCHQDAKEMLEELTSYPLLTGTRGKTGIPLGALEQHILYLSELLSDCPQIEELDINPLVFTEDQGFLCLDARARIA